MTKLYNISKLKETRRKLRKQEIGAEKLLWQKIRNKQLGYKFRRQFGIGTYVVDFYCPELRLAIELDGVTHSTEKEQKHDIERQKFIESLNIKVKRYNNQDVYKNTDLVLENIIQECKNTSPHPNHKFLPLNKGETQRG